MQEALSINSISLLGDRHLKQKQVNTYNEKTELESRYHPMVLKGAKHT